MPNWCEVDVTIQFTDKTEYDKFIQQADIAESTDPYLSADAEENGYGLFDRFVPTPKEMLDNGDWYWWRVNEWGTKWNPTIHSFYTNDDGQTITLSMNTAWSPPREFFETFHPMFPSTTIKMDYLEEGMGFCGKCLITDGDTHDRYINEIPTEAYVEMGAVLDSEGNIDWDKSEDVEPMWGIVESEELFTKFYEAEDNAAWAV